jgi:hypothetical protein
MHEVGVADRRLLQGAPESVHILGAEMLLRLEKTPSNRLFVG